MHTLKVFALILPTFLLLDLVWLGVLMKSFYSAELGDLARRQATTLAPRWGAAVLVYLLIPAGMVFFVRPLLLNNASIGKAFGWGAIYALIVYGVYDLTNLAVLDKWTVRMTVVDISWGIILCGSISILMLFADRWLTK